VILLAENRLNLTNYFGIKAPMGKSL